SLVIVRSPHAHARIERIEVDQARQFPGVIGAFTLTDLPELRDALPPPLVPAVSVRPYRQSALADGLVRFAGEPVVAIVANDPDCAADAAALVGIQYEPLPAATDPMLAADDPPVLVHPDWRTNVAATVTLTTGELDETLARAPLVVRRRIRCGRLTAL